jgi:hypothetical protein
MTPLAMHLTKLPLGNFTSQQLPLSLQELLLLWLLLQCKPKQHMEEIEQDDIFTPNTKNEMKPVA